MESNTLNLDSPILVRTQLLQLRPRPIVHVWDRKYLTNRYTGAKFTKEEHDVRDFHNIGMEWIVGETGYFGFWEPVPADEWFDRTVVNSK